MIIFETMKTKLLLLLLSIGLFSCQSEKPYSFDILEEKVYDIPFKTQYHERLVLNKPITKEGLNQLLQDEFKYAMQKEYKHHPEPTHIFIYVYKEKGDFEKDGSSWVGMISRVNGKDEGPQIRL